MTDKDLWEKSQVWDSSDDGRGKLKILQSVEKFAELIRSDKPVWVGLTQEDLKLLSAEWRIVYGAWMDDFARDIEAKLKEKNT